MMPEAATLLADEFWKRFNKIPFLFSAPGRINLIGEHVDYNGGLVMPAAIDKHFLFAIAPGRNDRCNVYAADFNEGVTFSIYDLNPGESWVNYLMGVIDAFLRKGIAIEGVDCIFNSNIPAGAGLSSSAALCSGFAFALNEIYKSGLNKVDLAKIAQYAENEFAGVNCGIMDPYASLFGEEGSALLLDCNSLKHEVLPAIDEHYTIMLVDSKVKHTLATSAYNDRRQSCEAGVRLIHKKHPSVKTLRDVSRTVLYESQDQLGEDTFVKCLFVIEEIARTQQAAELIKKKDWKSFGELMYLSHWGLSQAYDVSCEELDFLVLQAEEDKEKVPGARMMGGGFGGCTINLVQKNYEGIFKETVRKKYFATFKREPDFYPVKLSRGVHQINLPSSVK